MTWTQKHTDQTRWTSGCLWSTSHDRWDPPKGSGLGREMGPRLFQGNLGWWNTIPFGQISREMQVLEFFVSMVPRRPNGSWLRMGTFIEMVKAQGLRVLFGWFDVIIHGEVKVTRARWSPTDTSHKCSYFTPINGLINGYLGWFHPYKRSYNPTI